MNWFDWVLFAFFAVSAMTAAMDDDLQKSNVAMCVVLAIHLALILGVVYA